MCDTRLTMQQMSVEYPEQWLFVIEREDIEGPEQFSGIVVANSESCDEVCQYAKDLDFTGNVALHYTGRLPEGMVLLL